MSAPPATPARKSFFTGSPQVSRLRLIDLNLRLRPRVIGETGSAADFRSMFHSGNGMLPQADPAIQRRLNRGRSGRAAGPTRRPPSCPDLSGAPPKAWRFLERQLPGA